MPKQEVAFLSEPATLLHSHHGERSLLFDGRGRDSWGDGSVLFAEKPIAVLEIAADPSGDPMAALGRFLDEQLSSGSSVGVFVALAYDLKHSIESLPRRLPWPSTPILYAAAYDWAYRANRSSGRAELIAVDSEALARGLCRVAEAPKPATGLIASVSDMKASLSAAAYREMIDAAQEYIRSGDIYQANLAQEFSFAARPCDGPAIFERWTSRYPMPFAVYADAGDFSLISNSPECFLDVAWNAIATYPIKGTRGIDYGDDVDQLARGLANDPKELAEHLMIVDLERNDLGRLCRAGSVHVPRFQQVREFPMLIHLESEVRGELLPDVGLTEILRATFPGGSITGAPKIRAMEIIEELENLPRGFYTGALGWVAADRTARFNIAIRTGVLDEGGLSLHAGGGIVADSDADREFAETHTKLQSLFHVLAGDPAVASA